MKKERILKIILSMMCTLALVACGAIPDPSDPGTPEAHAPSHSSMDASDGSAADTPEGFDADAEAEIQGSVVDFSDGFCVITPMETGDDDRLAYQAAPGYEDPEKNITIHYQEGCVIQIAEINVASGERNLMDASIADIEKGASLTICGKWVSERDLNASAVTIVHYQ